MPRFSPLAEWQAGAFAAPGATLPRSGSGVANRPDEAASASSAVSAHSARWRDNGGTVLMGSVLGAAAGMAAGGALGAAVGAPTSDCGEYPCWFVLGIFGSIIGEPFGAGFGGWVGGRRRGSVVLDMLAATGVAAAGLVPMVEGEVHPAVVPAAQLVSIVLVDRAVAAARARRSRGRQSPDPFR